MSEHAKRQEIPSVEAMLSKARELNIKLKQVDGDIEKLAKERAVLLFRLQNLNPTKDYEEAIKVTADRKAIFLQIQDLKTERNMIAVELDRMVEQDYPDANSFINAPSPSELLN